MSKQKDIFEEIALPLVRDLLAGKNGLLFTYGVTGSGKTYSMLGNQQEAGLLQRSLDTLFNSISYQQAKKYTFKPDKLNSFELLNEVEAAIERQHQRKDASTKKSANNQPSACSSSDEANGKLVNILEDHVYAVFISCIEIYNNYIYDLLDTESKPASNNLNTKESKYLKEDAKGSMYIKDVAEIEVKSTEEALELMNKAQKRRVVAYTDLNAESSRSHSIFTIRVVQVQQEPSELLSNLNNNNNNTKSNVHISQLSLVDLAGSERTKRTKNTGCRLREAGSINSSLMALRNCMEVLKENVIYQNSADTRSHIKMLPHRDSKLTLLFKNYFEVTTQ
jgi:kinesin family protein 23